MKTLYIKDLVMKKICLSLLLIISVSVFASEGPGGGGADKYGNTNTGAKPHTGSEPEDYDHGATSLSQSAASGAMADGSTDSAGENAGNQPNSASEVAVVSHPNERVNVFGRNSRAKESGSAEKTVFNNLPDHLQKHIIGFLSGRDAVLGGLASKKLHELGRYGSRFLRAARAVKPIILDTKGQSVLCLEALECGRIIVACKYGELLLWNPDIVGCKEVVEEQQSDLNYMYLDDLCDDGPIEMRGGVHCAAVRGYRSILRLSNGSIKVYDFKKNKGEMGYLHLLSDFKGSQATALKILQDGKIIVGSADGTIRVYDLEKTKDEKNYMRLLKGHRDLVTIFEELNDGRIVSGSADGTIRVWNLKKLEGEQDYVFVLDGPRRAFIKNLLILSDGRIMSSGINHGARLWDTTKEEGERGYMLQLMGDSMNASTALLDLSDNRIVVGGSDGALRLFDLTKEPGELGYMRLLRSYNGATSVTALAQLNDGRIVSGHYNAGRYDAGHLCAVIRVWDLTKTRDEVGFVKILGRHDGVVSCLVPLQDNRIVVGTEYPGGLVQVWRTDGIVPNEEYFRNKFEKTQDQKKYKIDGPGIYYILFPHFAQAHNEATAAAVESSDGAETGGGGGSK
jgi:WD40 repeat protein